MDSLDFKLSVANPLLYPTVDKQNRSSGDEQLHAAIAKPRRINLIPDKLFRKQDAKDLPHYMN